MKRQVIIDDPQRALIWLIDHKNDESLSDRWGNIYFHQDPNMIGIEKWGVIDEEGTYDIYDVEYMSYNEFINNVENEELVGYEK